MPCGLRELFWQRNAPALHRFSVNNKVIKPTGGGLCFKSKIEGCSGSLMGRDLCYLTEGLVFPFPPSVPDPTLRCQFLTT